jgi:cytochrome c5
MGRNWVSVRNPATVAFARGGLTLAAAALSASLAATSALALERSGAEVVKSQCARCHEAGTAGAPKPGDKAAWAPRFNRGVEALVYSAVRGHGGMPPRGGKADLTDTELRSAVLYLFNPAGPPKEPAKAAQPVAPPGAGPQRVTAGGMDVYFGRISAERLRAFPPESPEAKLHGGIPAGSGYHHVNISVFDAATQAQITGATVDLDVEQVGMGRETKRLEASTISGGVSYGGYVRLAPKGAYVFVARIRKPGESAAVEARFQERLN